MNDQQTHKVIECARANQAKGCLVPFEDVIVDLAAEIDRLTQPLAKEEAVTGPSTVALIGHHLTEAIKHLSAAAELSRELTREDASELAMSLARTLEAVRDMRGEVDGSKTTDCTRCQDSGVLNYVTKGQDGEPYATFFCDCPAGQARRT